MSFPEYKEIENPLLVYIYLNGGDSFQIKADDSYGPLADYFGLPEEDRMKTRDEVFGDGKKEKAWNNRVQWARKSLNDYGYLDGTAGRGVWKLSESGITSAEKISSKFEFLNPSPLKTSIAIDIEPPERIETTIYRILRDTPLARQLKELHSNICQICGVTIKISDSKNYSEAHHIKPLGGGHKGIDTKENIIVLCPSHHVQCDYGAIDLSLKKIHSIPGHRISLEFIEYHNTKIFKKVP
ncbi:MAG: winged helix-turn-helix domain-containing protein [Desulfobacula sp.]|jgi:hypothetical protein